MGSAGRPAARRGVVRACAGPSPAPDARRRRGAQAAADAKPTLEIYGFGQADAIVDFKQNNPDWYDVNRPSRLPTVANQFGEGRPLLPERAPEPLRRQGPRCRPSNGDVKAQFEFDMFGIGVDAGQTTIRLRHAWGQWKQIGAGQTNSQFMDVDVFPNIARVLGTERHAVLPQRAGVLGAVQRRQLERAHRDRSAGRQRRRRRARPTASSCRTSSRASRRRTSPGTIAWAAKWGYVQVGGALR